MDNNLQTELSESADYSLEICEEIELYISNAAKVLEEAQSLCKNTNFRINIIRELLTNLQKKISKLKFLVDSLEKQGYFLLNTVLGYNIGEKLISQEWSQYVLIDLVNLMKQWQKKIYSRVEKLETIQNNLSEDKDNKFLSDYISNDNINVLQDKLDEVPIIEKHISNITVHYHSMMKKINDKLINKSLKEVQQCLIDQFDPNINADIVLLNETYPEELNNYEIDLVNFLDSLTDHFDKCQILKSCIKDNTFSISSEDENFNELLEIVRKDDKELSSIFVSLCGIIDDIDKSLSSFQKLLDVKVTDKDKLHSKINKIINDLNKNNEYLTIFKEIANLVSIFKSNCLKDIQMIKELNEFYCNFEKSYNNLLQEVERRRKYSNDMIKIIKDCEDKLTEMNVVDQNERLLFLEENGKFLPENIWSNEINDLTPIYSLEYSIKKI